MAHIQATGFYMIRAAIKYGLLYNWYAATDERGICSENFHLPTKEEFETLNTYLGGTSVAGGKLKETGLTYWLSPNEGANNISKFNARGSGQRISAGTFTIIKEQCLLWTNSYNEILKLPYAFGIYYNYESTSFPLISKKYGVSVRPIKDSTTLSDGEIGAYTGNDGQIYPTICIGTQEWVACNMAETKYGNGDLITEVTNNDDWAVLTSEALCAYNNDYSNK